MLESESHEIRLLLTNGKIVQFTLRELQGFVRSKNIIILAFATLFLLALSNPMLFPTIPLYTSRAFYWGLCIVIYILIVPTWAKYSYALWARVTAFPLPVLLSSVPLVVGLSYFADNLSLVLGKWAPDRGVEMTWVTVAKNCLIAHIVETVGLAWLLPLHRARNSQAQRRDHVEQPEETKVAELVDEFVVLNGRTLPRASILHVKSAEHYLIVTTKIGETEYRARMKDFVNQMGADCGVQTHRSHWVSAADAVELLGNVVKTRSGTEVPVSRGRISETREWFRAQGKPH